MASNSQVSSPDPTGGLLTNLGGLMNSNRKDLVFDAGLALMDASAPHLRVPGNVGAALQGAVNNFVGQEAAAQKIGLNQYALKRQQAMWPIEMARLHQLAQQAGSEPSPHPVASGPASSANTPFAPMQPSGNTGLSAPAARFANGAPDVNALGLPSPDAVPRGAPQAAPQPSPPQAAPYGLPTVPEAQHQIAGGLLDTWLGLPNGKEELQNAQKQEELGLQYNPAIQQRLAAAKSQLAIAEYEMQHAQTPEERNLAHIKALNAAGALKQIQKYDSTTGLQYPVLMNLAGNSGASPQGAPSGVPPLPQFNTGPSVVASGQPGASMIQNMDRHARAIAQYQQAPLSSYALSRPSGQALMARVYKYNPNYNASNWTALEKARTDFTDGKVGQQIQFLNRTVEHIATLRDMVKGLANGDVKLLNHAKNIWKTQTGSAAPVGFDATKQLVAAEILKAVQGIPGGEAERESLQKELSNANSPSQLKSVTQDALKLMKGQYDSLDQQWGAATSLPGVNEKSIQPFDSYFTKRALKALNSVSVGDKQKPQKGAINVSLGDLPQ